MPSYKPHRLANASSRFGCEANSRSNVFIKDIPGREEGHGPAAASGHSFRVCDRAPRPSQPSPLVRSLKVTELRDIYKIPLASERRSTRSAAPIYLFFFDSSRARGRLGRRGLALA